MDEMMNSVNTQIQMAISDAISNQILPQIQNALKAGSGHVTQNRFNVPAERPEINPEDYTVRKIETNQEVSQSVTVLMMITQTKLTTVTLILFIKKPGRP